MHGTLPLHAIGSVATLFLHKVAVAAVVDDDDTDKDDSSCAFGGNFAPNG